jgi:tRNA nucleotidyltransferase/poly(A) polymerase
MKLYRVGGCVRDQLLGIQPKDIDYLYVEDGASMETLTHYLKENGYRIILSTPECLTVRAAKDGVVSDFNLPRHEVTYTAASRRPVAAIGTLHDDLARRDFTVNAMAEPLGGGEIVDLFGGQQDLANKVLDTPVDPLRSFMDDPLRILRGFRFCITRGFQFSERVVAAIRDPTVWSKMQATVSKERIQSELHLCFKHDTVATLLMLQTFCDRTMLDVLFREVWLRPITQ